MFVKQLPDNVHSMLCATVKINNYKTAIEELIYNSVDANATSIAIRVHIKENSIQVIDNGQGIMGIDMNSMGLRYMTSKFKGLSDLNSVPVKYGLRGESLSNIIEISQIVSVTSRYEDTEKTWAKTFSNGKSRNLTETTKRPSKGTTVSINGFLYNRRIQKNTINELNELQEIKIFLEHISLLHSNISLSLRDDAKNLIVLQLHKKRDIYQTLSNIFNIEKTDFKELTVEKNQYKLRAYIGETNKDIRNYCIFLNRKLVCANSQLHNIINDNLNKKYKLTNKILKTKGYSNDYEKVPLETLFPFYFMFIDCPYVDYSMSHKNLEFKNWNQITKMLEKIIKFYIGDIRFKRVEVTNVKENFNSRDHIRAIMQKILGNSKKVEELQIKTGVKGKISKRKHKKKNKNVEVSALRASTKINVMHFAGNDHTKNNNNKILPLSYLRLIKNHIPNETLFAQAKINICCDSIQTTKEANLNNEINHRNIKIQNTRSQKVDICSGKNKIKKRHITSKLMGFNFFRDKPLSNFVSPTNSLKKRCGTIKHIGQKRPSLKIKNKKTTTKDTKQNKDITKTVQNNNYREVEDSIGNNTAHISQSKSKRKQFNKKYINQRRQGYRDIVSSLSPFKTTYDLVKTVINNNDNGDDGNYNKKIKINHFNREHLQTISAMTFQSHKYDKNETNKSQMLYHRNQQNRVLSNISTTDYHTINDNCESKKLFQSIRNTACNTHFCVNKNKKYIDFTTKKSMISDIEETSYSTNNCKSNRDNIYKDYERVRKNHNITITCISSVLSNVDKKASEGVPKEIFNYESKNNSRIDNQNKSPEQLHLKSGELIKSLHNSKVIDKNMEEILNLDIVNGNLSCPAQVQLPVSQERVLEPTNICQTLLSSQDIFESVISENAISSSYQFNILQDNNVNISHYFTNVVKSINIENVDITNRDPIQNKTFGLNTSTKINQITDKDHANKDQLDDKDCHKNNIATKFTYFSIKNRLRFVPKGMSPIFNNCNTKYVCDNNFDEDYFENILYDNFINDVNINSEVFNPLLKNIQNLGANANKNLQIMILEDNAALKFDDTSLKNAIILGQVDEKFIAGILQSINNQDKNVLKCLVLFDQHAVHERIRTEHNLSDYIKNNHWKSVNVEKTNMILPKDEIVYLHNYKIKFEELGLRFEIISSEAISVTAVPNAILGKSIREIDKVMKAVRNLIIEQINVIKTQSGCISVYPKAIMNLVFSEACRYAIKFGDTLNKDECINLIKDLSKCKTPFQCAHGRPVMAVLMDMHSEREEYKIDLKKVKSFKSIYQF